MKQRNSLVAIAALTVSLTMLAGCGGHDTTSSRAEEPVVPQVRTPDHARPRHALHAPAEARRLTTLINTRQASAMAQIDSER